MVICLYSVVSSVRSDSIYRKSSMQTEIMTMENYCCGVRENIPGPVWDC